MPKVTGKSVGLVPFWQTTDTQTVRLYQGHVLDVLRRMPATSVQCIITSPPYWGLRSYLDDGHDDKHLELGSEKIPFCRGYEFGPNCAERDWQNGCYVCRMVLVCRELRRVLRNDGVMWWNNGDTYWSGGNLCGIPWRLALALQADGWVLRSDVPWVKRSPMPESVTNRPAKALEYCFMLVKKMGYYYDGWAVKRVSAVGPIKKRSSRTSATTGYTTGSPTSGNQGNGVAFGGDGYQRNFWQADLWFQSVDTPHGLTGLDDELVGIDQTSQGYAGAHFATFPKKLIEPFLLSSTSTHGACSECGAPWVRVVESRQLKRERPNEYVKRTGEEGTGNSCANTVAGVESVMKGWRPGCECNGKLVKRRVSKSGCVINATTTSAKNKERLNTSMHSAKSTLATFNNAETTEVETEITVTEYISDLPLDEHPVRPCVVLDPFIGSGTTCVVALDHGRHSIGIDLSAKYLQKNAVSRVEGWLLGRRSQSHLAPRKPAERVDFD